ncbi:cohesin complex subunit [Lineolata rhizophorae]|uniref:Structural maintenance of chromosomes protein n=1 Tax=Lineolata rhizophorae TaxID=578093 RepID=A0A6A6PCK4_9PEZI|nr:cohesin complex subunit [Lineolata rhizophorae]
MGKLIRLELFNFKSYKGHHSLLFGDSYFTSIIGPNGSGKSNSMDAISFVLGIKSSHLRSSHLRDLVYRGRVLRTSKIHADGTATTLGDGEAPQTNGHTNGDAGHHSDDDEPTPTQTRSQRDDPQTAWVMAVYEDDAGDEQRWKRTITATGASEYRINNRLVSAKQYNDALEAENILIKARNFLVFQGDVEAIANQAPKDLTRLIEQISGSLEYKAEYDRLKIEAEKAADDQTFKLNQRRAINSEIKQYQEQKREAENYARKADERDQAIIKHVLWKLFHFQRVMDESGAEIQRHQEELKEYRRNVEKYEQRLEETRRDHAKVNQSVSKVERSIKAKEREIEEKENSLVPIDEKISISKGKIEKYAARVAELSKERDDQNRQVEHLQKSLDTVQKAQAKWEQEWTQLMQREGRELSEADLQEYNRLRGEVNKRTAADQIRVDNLTRQIKTDEETVNSLLSKVETSQAQVQKLDEEMRELKERRANVNSLVKETQKEIDAKKKAFNKAQSERLRKEQLQTELNERLQEILKQLAEADNGRRESEKEQRARETVAAMKRIFPGVRGRVHELCKPKQKRYETAVSTVLGRHFDAIVVDTEKTAKDCIGYLRDQRAGQATFIPLDTIQVKAVNSSLKAAHRGVRLAIDTIEYDSVVERAMSYACGNSVVCDTLDIARDLCYEKRVDAKAVTLDGVVIHKGGLITGGRGPNDARNARRWEDAEVEALRHQKDKIMADLNALPKSTRRVEEETLQGELAGLEQRLHYAHEESRALERNLASKKSERDHAARQLAEARPKHAEHAARLSSLRDELKGHAERVAEAEDNVFADFCARLGYADIRAYEARQGSAQQEHAQKKLQFTTQRSRLENQLSFERQRANGTAERVASLEATARRDEELLERLGEQKEDLQAELDALREELETLAGQLDAQKEKLSARAERVNEARRELARRSRNVEGALKAVAELEAEVQRAAAGRYALLRKCKIDEVKVPLVEGSATLDSLPLDNLLRQDPDAMDVDGEEEEKDGIAAQAVEVQDYGIEVDFDGLDEELKEDPSPKAEEPLLETISTLSAQLDKISPNLRAIERLSGVEGRLKTAEKDFEGSRRAARRARADFEDVREKRLELFNKAFSHISEQIGGVYKDLTRSAAFPLGGQAHLDTEDDEEPYNAGVKYHAMPPLKRFRDMEHLSGGEKTIAALALLFAIHSFQPSPFFVLDEVDAALDAVNVAKVAGYVKEHAGPGMQFIVISLKSGLFQESETLVGVARDQGANSSRVVTLDLRKYQPS